MHQQDTDSSSEEMRRINKAKEQKLEYNPTIDFQGQNVPRSDTPETLLPDLVSTPDISLKCEKCKDFVDLRSLRDHRVFHDALETLKYMGSNRPPNIEGLLRRRNAVLRKMKKIATPESPIDAKDISKVNDAYEYLKAEIDGTFGELRQVKEEVDAQVKGISLTCSPACVQAVGTCASGNDRWKSYMEDTHVFEDCLGEDINKCYFGIFDGHHGRFAAEVAASELHHLLLHEMAKFDPKTKSDSLLNLGESQDFSQYDFHRPGSKGSEVADLQEESVNLVQQIIKLCEDKYEELLEQKALLKSEKKQTKSQETSKSEEEKENIGQSTPRKKHKEQKSPFSIKMESALHKTYYLLDILLSYGKDERSRVRWSGCSALTVVIQDTGNYKDEKGSNSRLLTGEEGDNNSDKENKDSLTDDSSNKSKLDPPRELGMLYLANAGDVKAVLVRANKAYKLTKDHIPDNPKERDRILKAGGDISDSKTQIQVNGVLNTTRGLGNHGDVRLKRCVLVDPHTMSVPIDQYAQFVLLASQGVWEVFTEQEAASLLLKLLPSNYIPAPSRVSTTLRPLLEECNTPGLLTSLPSPRKVSFPQLDMQDDIHSQDALLEFNNDSLISPKSPIKSSSRLETEMKNDSDVISPVKTSLDREKIKSAESGKSQRSGDKSVAFSEKSEILSEKSSNISGISNHVTTNIVENSNGMEEKMSDRHVQAEDSFAAPMFQLEDEDSGNEADVETMTDGLNLSRLSNYEGGLTREQMQREFSKTMAEHLVQAALLAGSKDNITVSVILLSGSGL